MILGNDVYMPDGSYSCGPNSTIIIEDKTAATSGPRVNCRNGGIIFIGSDGLWSANIRIFSDDMHAILNLSDNKRINDFGGKVIVEEHVWLGYDAMLLPGTQLGRDSIVGARSVVSKPMPSNSIHAGIPAKTVRSDVTWDKADLP